MDSYSVETSPPAVLATPARVNRPLLPMSTIPAEANPWLMLKAVPSISSDPTVSVPSEVKAPVRAVLVVNAPVMLKASVCTTAALVM